MRFARYHPPHAAPAIDTMYSNINKAGDTRGCGLTATIVRVRVRAGVREVGAGAWAAARAAVTAVGRAACDDVLAAGFGTPESVPCDE